MGGGGGVLKIKICTKFVSREIIRSDSVVTQDHNCIKNFPQFKKAKGGFIYLGNFHFSYCNIKTAKAKLQNKKNRRRFSEDCSTTENKK